MIKSTIKKIRQKPKETRDRIALGIAGIFTAFVALIWMYNIPAKYSEITVSRNQNNESESFFALFGKFREQFTGAKESIAESITVDQNNTELIDTKVILRDNRTEINDFSSEVWNVQQANVNLSSKSSNNNQLKVSTSTSTSAEGVNEISSESTSKPIRIVTINNATSSQSTSTIISD